MRPVTPCVGVWIETSVDMYISTITKVTPCVGVWIETVYAPVISMLMTSHPAWVCGLKLNADRDAAPFISHTLRGCVD